MSLEMSTHIMKTGIHRWRLTWCSTSNWQYRSRYTEWQQPNLRYTHLQQLSWCYIGLVITCLQHYLVGLNRDHLRIAVQLQRQIVQKEAKRRCYTRKKYREGLKDLHTKAVAVVKDNHKPPVTLGGYPPPIAKEERTLPRITRCKLAQLRVGYSPLLQSYMSRIDFNAVNRC